MEASEIKMEYDNYKIEYNEKKTHRICILSLSTHRYRPDIRTPQRIHS